MVDLKKMSRSNVLSNVDSNVLSTAQFICRSNAYSLIVISIFSLHCIACQNGFHKKNSEVLNGSEVLGGVPNAGEPGMDDSDNAAGSGADASAMWSPSTRRVTAMYQFLVAQKLVSQNNLAGAAQYFEASYNLEPNSFTGARLVRSKLMTNTHNGDGMQEARRMSLLYPNDADLRLIFGQVLLQQAKPKEAEIQLTKAIILNPLLDDAYVALAKCYQMQGDVEAAISTARRLTKANPSSIQGWELLTRILVSAKRSNEALIPARRAWEQQENNPELALLYALTLDLNKRSKEAVKLYEQLYRFNPGNTELVQRMINLYKDLGTLPSALSLIDDMIENSRTEVPGLKLQRVLILWEMRRNAEALKMAQELVAEFPESDTAMYTVGTALVIVGRPEEAAAYFEKIPAKSELKGDGMMSQALALRQAGKIDEAVNVAKELCKNPEAKVENYLFLASILSGATRHKEAVAVIDGAIVKFPGVVELFFEKGVYQEKAGDRAGSEMSMRQVVEKDPKNAAALNFVAYLLAEDGRQLVEAEGLVQRALVLQPKNGAFLDTLGWIYFQRRDYKAAVVIFEKSIAIEAKEGVIWEHLGDALLALGHKKEALEKYRDGLKCQNEELDQVRIQKKFDDLSSKKAIGE
jgi:tetratricopeptide (TPR) repeat protein